MMRSPVLTVSLRETPLVGQDNSRSTFLPTQPHKQPHSHQRINLVLNSSALLTVAGLLSN